MIDGELELREALVEIFLQALLGRGVPGAESGDQGPPPEGHPVIGGKEDLLVEILVLSRGQPREPREDVPELMDLPLLPSAVREDLAYGLCRTAAAVEDDKQGLAEGPSCQVVQEGHQAIRALPCRKDARDRPYRIHSSR